MAGIVVGLIALGVLIGVFQFIGMKGVIALLIGGGVGFAIGESSGIGWAIFGAVTGGLVCVYLLNKSKFDELSE